MTERDITDPQIEAYAVAHTSPEPAYLAAVDRDTHARFPSRAGMLTGRLEGRFLTMLVAMLGARRILEIGTFTGYSALSMADAMGDDGTLITCELDEQHAAVARANIAASPHAGRIEVREGPALDTVRALDGPFDLIFIDANKQGYPAYYEEALRLVAPNGVIAFDNTLWGGDVLEPEPGDADTAGIVTLNDRVVSDPTVQAVLLPVRDGLTLIRKRV